MKYLFLFASLCLLVTANATSPVHGSDENRSEGELMKGMLRAVVEDLKIIHKNLRADKKKAAAAEVHAHIVLVRAVIINTNDDNANRDAVVFAMDRGIELVNKYEEYLRNDTTESSLVILNEENTEGQTTVDYEKPDEHSTKPDIPDEDSTKPNIPDETEEEANKRRLLELRAKLVQLRDRLDQEGDRRAVRVIERYLRALDGLMRKLEKGRTGMTDRINDFLRRAEELLEKYENRH